jgi:hypothetical protein
MGGGRRVLLKIDRIYVGDFEMIRAIVLVGICKGMIIAFDRFAWPIARVCQWTVLASLERVTDRESSLKQLA